MSGPISLVLKSVNILLSEGPISLLIKSIKAFRARTQNRASAEIDRIAKSNISNSEKFSLIYKKRLWFNAVLDSNSDKTPSGHGSTLSSTGTLRQGLEKFLIESRVKKFFDAPCGDFNWMRALHLPADCAYIGGDIVPELVAKLQHRYGRTAKAGPSQIASREFVNFDLTSDSFPEADIWLCKDCLQHLSNADIWLVLNNFRSSKVEIALITNYAGVSHNVDIQTGLYRPVDLTRAPFNLPAPWQILQDAPSDSDPRFIGIWRRADLS
jgi:hypothetical protein